MTHSNYFATITTINKGLVKKIVALHRCGFNLKFPKHFNYDRYFG